MLQLRLSLSQLAPLRRPIFRSLLPCQLTIRSSGPLPYRRRCYHALSRQRPLSSSVRAHMKRRSRVYSYAYLLMVAHRSLKVAKTAADPFLDCMNIMLYSALASEAFLNHVGSQLIPLWAPLKKKLSTVEKLDFLAASKGISIEWGVRPYQSLSTALRFRSLLVHAETSLVDQDLLYGGFSGSANHWHPYCQLDVAERTIQDVGELIRALPAQLGATVPPAYLLAEAISAP